MEGRLTASEVNGEIENAVAIGSANLYRAWRVGLPLVTGSNGGQLLVFQGPLISERCSRGCEQEFRRSTTLMAATSTAAQLLKAGERLGVIRPRYDTGFLLLNGNPLEDIAARERISIIFKGERIDRAALFEQKN